MKTWVVGLSLLGLMLGSCKLKAEAKAEEKTTDAAVVAAAQSVTSTTGEDQQPIFKSVDVAKPQKSESGVWLWFRTLGSLAVVLILFIGSLYAFKRFPAGRSAVGRHKMIQVMAQHHLGTKKSLAVVRVAGETVLIGITDQNISILKNLSLLEEEVSTPTKTSKTFDTTLAQKIVPEEDFSMRGLRDAIGNKLKNMKELG